MKFYYFYTLLSFKDGALYFGYTDNVERRFSEHTKGFVGSTKDRRPLKLLYYEAYNIEAGARERERQIKRRSKAYISLKTRLRESIVLLLAERSRENQLTLPRVNTVGG